MCLRIRHTFLEPKEWLMMMMMLGLMSLMRCDVQRTNDSDDDDDKEFYFGRIMQGAEQGT